MYNDNEGFVSKLEFDEKLATMVAMIEGKDADDIADTLLRLLKSIFEFEELDDNE